MLGEVVREYRVVRRLGQGGMAQVWLGEHVGTGDRVALKFLAAGLKAFAGLQARFVSEARSLAKLDHPHIVRIRDFFLWRSEFCLVMEYVEGHSLRTVLQRDGALSAAQAIDVSLQVLDALRYAHELGVIHRDVNARNIMISQQDQAKIMDFGIALDREIRAIERQGMIWGTPAYMSPERIREPAKMDLRSDVYSFGVVLYQMLAGDLPYWGEQPSEIWHQHLNAPVPRIADRTPSVDGGLDAIVQKALQKEPQERFQDCASFREALMRYAEEVLPRGARFDQAKDSAWRTFFRGFGRRRKKASSV